MVQFQRMLHKFRANRPIFGGSLLIVSGVYTLYIVYGLSFNAGVNYLSLIFGPLFLDMGLGISLVGGGIIALSRPSLSFTVGISLIIYIILVALFSGFIAPGWWVPLSFIGGVLCISWYRTNISNNKPPTNTLTDQ